MRIRIVLVFTILLSPALSLVCEGAESSLKVARKQVYTIVLSSRSRFAGAIQIDNEGGELTKASKRQHLRKMLARRLQDVSNGDCNAVAVATRFRSAQLRRQMGDPANDRPVKAVFILCNAKKKVGVRVAMTSPRRALKQFSIPPLPFFTQPSPPPPPRFQFPPLPFFTPPASPRLPFTPPALVAPQLQAPPSSSSKSMPTP